MLHVAQKDVFASCLPHFNSPPKIVTILMSFYPVSSDTEAIILLMNQRQGKIYQVNSNFITNF